MSLDEMIAQEHDKRREKDPCWGCLFYPDCSKRLKGKLCETVKKAKDE